MYTPTQKATDLTKFKSLYNIELYKNDRKIELYDKTKRDVPGPGTYRVPSDFGYLPSSLPLVEPHISKYALSHQRVASESKLSKLGTIGTVLATHHGTTLGTMLGSPRDHRDPVHLPTEPRSNKSLNMTQKQIQNEQGHALATSASIPVLPTRLKLKPNARQSRDVKEAT